MPGGIFYQASKQKGSPMKTPRVQATYDDDMSSWLVSLETHVLRWTIEILPVSGGYTLTDATDRAVAAACDMRLPAYCEETCIHEGPSAAFAD